MTTTRTKPISLFVSLRDERGLTYVIALAEPRRMGYDGEATHACIWFNRTTRDWVVSASNGLGQQVGSSEYVYSREEAEEIALDLASGDLDRI